MSADMDDMPIDPHEHAEPEFDREKAIADMQAKLRKTAAMDALIADSADLYDAPASADALGEVDDSLAQKAFSLARKKWAENPLDCTPPWEEQDKFIRNEWRDMAGYFTAALSAMSPAGEVENKPCKNCGFMPENAD